MIRLTHLCGSLQGTTTASEKKALRIGSSTDCDVRFDPARDPSVSNYHSAIVLKDGGYFLIDTGSATGTWVNGKKTQSHQLRTGDRVRWGGPDGPEATVEITVDPSYDPQKDAAEMARVLKTGTRETEAIRLVTQAAQKVAEERALSGGHRSRKTMDIMANTLKEVSQVVQLKSKRKWVRVVVVVAGVAAVFIGIMGLVIYVQHREIAMLLDAKGRFDAQIQAIEQQMQAEQDSLRLVELERQLVEATNNAEKTLAEISRADKEKGAEVAERGDELDREIRLILRQFDAETYAVPPIFKERLGYHINQLTKSPTTKLIYRRKVKYWPAITKEFKALGLPEAMAYVAWTESQFDPSATSTAGARGMWQMTPSTAKSLGLRVDQQIDERTDVPKQTRAAARHLAYLLADFGEDSFMLAMAGYNRGENAVRRVLRQVAQEPGGFKKEKRDFWHLYRLKKLPPETREYVPKILAAAVVCSNPEKYSLVN